MAYMKGTVIHGEKKGRILGFPTANIDVGQVPPEGTGIYAGYVILQGQKYGAALYLAGNTLVEAFIFDFTGDLYGQDVEVSIGKKVREKRDFNDEKEAIEQITKDVEEIRKCLQE
jgi:riboflavin kinase/FMN adenylyltransferase